MTAAYGGLPLATALDAWHASISTRAGAFHTRATEFHARNRLPQKESRRVGTRRLPYVGDRVGGLGVRPPALGCSMW